MLDFTDAPYTWFPPKRRPWFVWFLGRINRRSHLPNVLNISGVDVSGDYASLRRRRLKRGQRLLLLPNHPTHADAPIFFEVVRQAKLSTNIMAAYDVFLRSRRDAFLMQRIGCFSVDREGSDSRAMKHASETLQRGRHALTMFPEGNVYLMNDRVAPFHEGAAFLALKTLRDLKSEPDADILAVPISMKMTYIDDVRPNIMNTLADLAKRIGVDRNASAKPWDCIREIGKAGLFRHLKGRGYDVEGLGHEYGETMQDLINKAAALVMDRLEQKMELKARPKDSLTDRIRRARRVIHDIRVDPERAHDHALAAHWSDDAMLAFRIASYAGDYIAERPTIDRIGETAEKLWEDAHATMSQSFGNRRALVHFNEPVSLRDYLDAFNAKARDAVRQVTETCEQRLQGGLDLLNEKNEHIGGKLWDEA